MGTVIISISDMELYYPSPTGNLFFNVFGFETTVSKFRLIWPSKASLFFFFFFFFLLSFLLMSTSKLKFAILLLLFFACFFFFYECS